MDLTPTYRNKKWTSLKQTLDFFLQNWPKLTRVANTPHDIFTDTDSENDSDVDSDEEAELYDSGAGTPQRRWNWTSTFNMLSVFSALVEPLTTLTVTLQTAGPLDGYIMTQNVMKALHAIVSRTFYIAEWKHDVGATVAAPLEFVQLEPDSLNSEQREVYESLLPMLDMAQKRLVRRFFFNSLGSDLGNAYFAPGYFVDRTYKFDYFQNTCVLALYAMSPDFDFLFLNSGFPGLASGNEILSLAARSKEAAWLLYIATHEVQAEGVIQNPIQSQKRVRLDLAAPPAAANSAKSIFFKKLASLNGSDKLKLALQKFVESTESLEDRQVLLGVWADEARRICPTLGGLLRICGAQLYSNAIGESNFSSVTRLLSDQRLRSGGKLLAAQLLASRARSWAQFKDPAPDMVKKVQTQTKRGVINSYFPAASLPMGEALKREEEEESLHEGDEVVCVGEDYDVHDAVSITTSRTTTSTTSAGTTSTTTTTPNPTAATSPRAATTPTTSTSTRPQRANRGVRMAAVLGVISFERARGRGRVVNSDLLNLEAGDGDENVDPDYEE
jgi:hypothetical protein